MTFLALILRNNSTCFCIYISDSFPKLNFAFHCYTGLSADYPSLLRCPGIELAIDECHLHNKKVLLSLGGGVGDYGFDSVEKAKLLAYRVWNLFLGGKNMKKLRPFGR